MRYRFFSYASVFLRWKVTGNENINFADHASRFLLPDGSKLAINWKIDNHTTFCWHNVIVKFFDVACFFCHFGYWFKFHVNIIAGSWITAIFLYKGLTRNAEIENLTICDLSNIWRSGQFRDGKFGKNVSNEMLLNAARCHGCSIWCFWVIIKKPTGRIKLPHPPPKTRIGVDIHRTYLN